MFQVNNDNVEAVFTNSPGQTSYITYAKDIIARPMHDTNPRRHVLRGKSAPDPPPFQLVGQRQTANDVAHAGLRVAIAAEKDVHSSIPVFPDNTVPGKPAGVKFSCLT